MWLLTTATQCTQSELRSSLSVRYALDFKDKKNIKWLNKFFIDMLKGVFI